MLESTFKLVRDGFLSLAYPADCRVCGDAVESWDYGIACHRCWTNPSITKLFNEHDVCAKCGLPLRPRSSAGDRIRPGQASSPQPDSACGRCALLPYAAARACGAYTGALEAGVLFLKQHPHICARLKHVITQTLLSHRSAIKADLVVPVPLHRTRERERGFNQAGMIGRVAAKVCGCEMENHLLIRTKHTERHRAGMDARDRAKSVDRAFKVSNPESVRGKAILLIDDVYTTGSTVCAAAQSLIEAGAQRVGVFTIARVI